MSTRLYLDSARLGRISPRAQRALIDFVRLTGEEGLSLYYERFLHEGFPASDARFRRKFPGLRDWRGIGELKSALCRVLNPNQQWPVLLAARSTQLMRLAIRQLIRRTHHILYTDLTWPAYAKLLREEARQAGRRLTLVRLRRQILHEHRPPLRVVPRILDLFEQQPCDGLFLPAISHDGIRLPFAQLASAMRSRDARSFVVLDGAQHFAHACDPLASGTCDIYVAGGHKWLATGQPIALACLMNPATQFTLPNEFVEPSRHGDTADSILSLTSAFESGQPPRFTETVNLAPLFACRAAVQDWFESHTSRVVCRIQQRLNVHALAQQAVKHDWRPLLPAGGFESGILVLQSERAAVRRANPDRVRAILANRGLAITAYRHGRIRIAAHHIAWSTGDLAKITNALDTCCRVCELSVSQVAAERDQRVGVAL